MSAATAASGERGLRDRVAVLQPSAGRRHAFRWTVESGAQFLRAIARAWRIVRDRAASGVR